MTFVWLAVIGVLVVVELLTYGLYFAALAVAAIVPLVLSLLGFELWVQALGFLGASVAALVYVRPLIKKWQGEKPERLTNTQSLIGREALALTEINEQGGQAKVWGEVWTARVREGMRSEGAKLVVEEIDGATLIVR
jgi:membrane protein implicated in regulation of membrane protease activity